jgi:hypothetical protein
MPKSSDTTLLTSLKGDVGAYIYIGTKVSIHSSGMRLSIWLID